MGVWIGTQRAASAISVVEQKESRSRPGEKRTERQILCGLLVNSLIPRSVVHYDGDAGRSA